MKACNLQWNSHQMSPLPFWWIPFWYTDAALRGGMFQTTAEKEGPLALPTPGAYNHS
jgi:hypothetical protein